MMNIRGTAGRRSSFLFAALSLLALGGCMPEVIIANNSSGGSGGSTSTVGSSGSPSATSSSSSGTPPIEPNDALLAVGQCMSRVGFLDLDIVQLYNLQTDGGCTCAMCHAASEAALNGGQFVLDPDADVTFEAARQFPGLLNFVELDPTGQGVVQSHIIEVKGYDLGVCSCQTTLSFKVNGVINVNDPAYCHPDYAVPVAFVDQLDVFVQTAIARSQALVCNADNTK